LQRSIVVAGAHGKTTTAAMIAFCLDRLATTRLLDRRRDPQLGGKRARASGWARRRGRRIGPPIAALRPEIAVVTNVDLDHHTEFASRAEGRVALCRLARGRPESRPRRRARAVEVELAVPVTTTCRTLRSPWRR